MVHGYGPGAGQGARRDARETALCRCRRVLQPADRIGGRRCCHRGSGAGKQCRRSGQDRDHPSMPAHDLPYVEPAGGQNAEASSVVKAVSLARSRKTALPAACRCGQGTAGGSSRAAGAPAGCLAAGSGDAPRPPLVAGHPASPRPGRRAWARYGRPSPALALPWPGPAAAPGTGGPRRGTAAAGRDLAGMARPGWGKSGSVSCLMEPLPVRACPALGSLGYRGARDLTGRPGRRRSCRNGPAGEARWAASVPLKTALENGPAGNR